MRQVRNELKTFVDTNYVLALVNPRDQYHQRARKFAKIFEGQTLLVTDAVLLEIGNGLARYFKQEAVEVLDDFLESKDVELIRLTPELFAKAFDLYRSHLDKERGMIDCVSFVVMKDQGVTDALTFDKHFVQAGFHALLRDGC